MFYNKFKNVIKETKRVVEFQPKMEKLFHEVNTFTKSHQTLEKENRSLQREVQMLTTENENLVKENKHLKDYLKMIIEAIKRFLRELLQIGDEKTKDRASREVKGYYDNKDFTSDDVYNISKSTSKEDELFDYAKVPSYLKTRKKSNKEKHKDDFDIGF